MPGYLEQYYEPDSGAPSPQHMGAQRYAKARTNKRRAMQRFMQMLDQRRGMSPDEIMYLAHQLGGDYAGLDFGSARYKLPQDLLMQNAPRANGRGGPDPSLLDLFTRDAPRRR